MKKIYAVSLIITMLLTGAVADAQTRMAMTDMQKKLQVLHHNAPTINPEVLRLSLIAYQHAGKKGLTNKEILTVIDYSRPSYEKRLWVFDLHTNRALYNTWVSHGMKSGDVRSTLFSNRFRSHQSSIGVFLTDETYMGHSGYALRLRGLEPGYNDHAMERATVIHGAAYVNANLVQKYGRIGRSWGCPAVSPQLARPIINTIKHHSVVVAYYPNKNWLLHSRYLVA